jgi:hypothetical protein
MRKHSVRSGGHWNPGILEPSNPMDDGFDYMRILLMEIYERLYGAYGPQHWWPGETPFEMMILSRGEGF